MSSDDRRQREDELDLHVRRLCSGGMFNRAYAHRARQETATYIRPPDNNLNRAWVPVLPATLYKVHPLTAGACDDSEHESATHFTRKGVYSDGLLLPFVHPPKHATLPNSTIKPKTPPDEGKFYSRQHHHPYQRNPCQRYTRTWTRSRPNESIRARDERGANSRDWDHDRNHASRQPWERSPKRRSPSRSRSRSKSRSRSRSSRGPRHSRSGSLNSPCAAPDDDDELVATTINSTSITKFRSKEASGADAEPPSTSTIAAMTAVASIPMHIDARAQVTTPPPQEQALVQQQAAPLTRGEAIRACTMLSRDLADSMPGPAVSIVRLPLPQDFSWNQDITNYVANQVADLQSLAMQQKNAAEALSTPLAKQGKRRRKNIVTSPSASPPPAKQTAPKRIRLLAPTQPDDPHATSFDAFAIFLDQACRQHGEMLINILRMGGRQPDAPKQLATLLHDAMHRILNQLVPSFVTLPETLPLDDTEPNEATLKLANALVDLFDKSQSLCAASSRSLGLSAEGMLSPRLAALRRAASIAWPSALMYLHSLRAQALIIALKSPNSHFMGTQLAETYHKLRVLRAEIVAAFEEHYASLARDYDSDHEPQSSGATAESSAVRRSCSHSSTSSISSGSSNSSGYAVAPWAGATDSNPLEQKLHRSVARLVNANALDSSYATRVMHVLRILQSLCATRS